MAVVDCRTGTGKVWDYRISTAGTGTVAHCVVSVGLYWAVVDCIISVGLVLGQLWTTSYQ